MKAKVKTFQHPIIDGDARVRGFIRKIIIITKINKSAKKKKEIRIFY